MGHFGFSKIPLEVVQLAIQLEDFTIRLGTMAEEDHGVNPFQHQIKVARQLVDFLRLGRRLEVERKTRK